jgi:hypothetical protein
LTGWTYVENKMTDYVLRMYDTLPGAELARDALLAAGYSPDDVQLEAMNDEAGPAEGNFTVGNGEEDPAGLSGAMRDGEYRGDHPNASVGYQPVRDRSIIRLTVAVDSDARHAQAVGILDRVDMSAA